MKFDDILATSRQGVAIKEEKKYFVCSFLTDVSTWLLALFQTAVRETLLEMHEGIISRVHKTFHIELVEL